MHVRSATNVWKHIQRGLRGAALAGIAAAIACTDHAPSSTGMISPGHLRFSIAPSFQALPPGVPNVALSRIQGILIGANGDSTVVSASFAGDSAVMSFDVQFAGSSATFTLELSAFDEHNVLAYRAVQRVTLHAGDNAAIAAPQLAYAAPDAGLATLHVAPASVTLNAGNGTSLSASGVDSSGHSLAPLRLGWTSNDASIATVDPSGAVHAGAFQGSTYIVARSVLGVSDSTRITVHAPVDHIAIAPSPVQVVRGLSTGVGAELRDAGNHLIDDRAASWTVADPSVATVSQTGAISGLKIGSTTITAAAEGKTATATLNVVSPIDHIEITPSPLTFASIRETRTLVPLLVPRPGASVEGLPVQWSSASSAVATVDASGKVTAIDNGSVAITATSDGVVGMITATVQQVATTLRMNPKSATASFIGATAGFIGVAGDALGSPMPPSAVTYSSSNDAIATVSPTGVATARGNGTARIYATAGALRDSADYIVAPAPAGLVLNVDRPAIPVGDVAQLSGHLVDAGGNALPTPTIAWNALTPAVATVNAAGVVTGVAQGSAQFSGAASGFTNTITVTVGDNRGPSGPGVVNGQVVNAATGLPIAGATISGGSGATSNADGTFAVTGVANGGTLTIAASGFVTTQYANVAINATTSTQLGNIPLAPQSGVPGVISGQIINATSGNGIAGASVAFRSGINVTTGAAVATATTDGSGAYSIQLAPGSYTATASASGFANGTNGIVAVGGSTMTNQNVSLVPTSGLRITLTWGADPRDLDSHLFGPTASGGRFHTWWNARTGPDGETLDHDDTNGFGPENTTVLNPLPGEYRFYVQHFAGASSMAASGATVTVTLNGTVIGTFHPPTDPSERNGDIWEVFSLTNGAITPLNVIVPGNTGNVPEVLNNRRATTASARGAAATTSTLASDLAALRGALGKAKP